MIEAQIKKFQEMIDSSDNIVFFGGAGVSVPSGIPDFRSAEGLYVKKHKMEYTPEQIVSRSFFWAFPEMFFDFYISKMVNLNVRPNIVHTYLTKLEESGKLKAIVTQNIDGFHQIAGSKNVFELHGSIHRNYCTNCHKAFDATVLKLGEIPHCDACGALIKPDVVLFEEGLDQDTLLGAIAAIKGADTLIIGGTSLIVQPAASLISYFRGQNLIVINKEERTVPTYVTQTPLYIVSDIAAVFNKLKINR